MFKNTELWASIVAFLLGGTSLAKLYESFQKWRLNRAKSKLLKKVKAGYEDTVSMYEDVFFPIINQTNVERVLFLRCHDSGNLTSPIQKWYATIILEAYEGHLNSIKRDYSEYELDLSYIKTLVNALNNERLGSTIAIEELPENSLQKQIFVGLGVKAAQVFIIKVKEGEVYYISLWATKASFDTSKEQLHIANKIALARKLTDQY